MCKFDDCSLDYFQKNPFKNNVTLTLSREFFLSLEFFNLPFLVNGLIFVVYLRLFFKFFAEKYAYKSQVTLT